VIERPIRIELVSERKLTEQQVAEIRSRYRRGNGVKIAAEYGVSSSTVSAIVTGRKYPNAPGEIRSSSRTTRPGEARAWLEGFIAAFEAGAYSEQCVLWPFTCNRGYAQIGTSGERRVTRIIVERLIGQPLAHGEMVCHSCDVRQCINPAHLFVGTAQDNVDDMVRKGRQAYGSRIASARLSETDVRTIRALGRYMSAAGLAQRFEVSPSHVYSIVRGRFWSKPQTALRVAA
jgi:hypothetical protein